MKRKVLILCTDFMYYSNSLMKAFKNLGWDVKVEIGDLSLHRNQYLKRFLHYCFDYSVKDDFLKKRKLYNDRIISTVNSFCPELIYCSFLPVLLTKETIEYAKNKAKIIIALPDALELMENGSENIELFDFVFSFENTDIVKLDKKGVTCYPFMGSYDEDYYHKIDCEKTIDVCFVGKMYPERKEILEKLVYDLPNVKFCFYGEYAPIRKPWLYIKWVLNKRIRSSFKNIKIPYEEVNKLYNSSKITLNIHRSLSKDGWASRLPEVSATGTLQIVDSNPAIEKEFGEDFVIYHTYDELKDKIIFFLSNSDVRERIAQMERQHVLPMTVTNNIRTVLGIVGYDV